MAFHVLVGRTLFFSHNHHHRHHSLSLSITMDLRISISGKVHSGTCNLDTGRQFSKCRIQSATLCMVRNCRGRGEGGWKFVIRRGSGCKMGGGALAEYLAQACPLCVCPTDRRPPGLVLASQVPSKWIQQKRRPPPSEDGCGEFDAKDWIPRNSRAHCLYLMA